MISRLRQPSRRRRERTKPVELPPFDTASTASLTTETSSLPFHGLLSAPTLVLTPPPHLPPPCPPSPISSSLHPSLVRLSTIEHTLPFTILAPSHHTPSSLNSLLRPTFSILNEHLNRWNPNSSLSVLNRSKPSKSQLVPPPLLSLLHLLPSIHAVTDSRFDPTVTPVSHAFHNHLHTHNHPPSASQLAPLRLSVSLRTAVTITQTHLTRHTAHVQIDLDGIVKGYVLDMLYEQLHTTHPALYLDYAGDIFACGRHPQGRAWQAAIVAPPSTKTVFRHWHSGTLGDMLQEDDIMFIASFPEEGAALATSGDYFACKRFGFHHIVEPKERVVRRISDDGVGGVAVMAKTGALADAVATAGMTCASVDEAWSFLEDVMRKCDGKILGVCVMSRTKERWSEDVFEKVRERKNEMMGKNDSSLEKVREKIERRQVMVGKTRSEGIVVVSMEPEVVVMWLGEGDKTVRVAMGGTALKVEICDKVNMGEESAVLGFVKEVEGMENGKKIGEKVREVFGGMRASVWVVMVEKGNGWVGVMATSVVVMKTGVCFNVGVKGVVGREMEMGKRVRLVLGRKGMEQVVSKYRKGGGGQVWGSGVVEIEGQVAKTKLLQDHWVVVANVQQSNLKEGQGLVWCGGNFV